MTAPPPTTNQHCGETCTLVEKTVELFGDQMPRESRLALAVEAVRSGKMSQSGAARTYRVPRKTIADNVQVAYSGETARVGQSAPTKVRDSKGRLRLLAHEYPPEIKDAAIKRVINGESQRKVSKEMGIARETVRKWCDATSSDENAGTDPVICQCEKPETQQPEQPRNSQATERPAKPSKPQIPAAVRDMHNRERRWVKERWEPAAQHLRAAYELIRAENDRLGAQYRGKHGSLIMQRRWQALAEAWQANAVLGEFPAITGEPRTAELDALLLEMERMARMTRAWVDSLRMYTGCRPCNTRWKEPEEPRLDPEGE